MVATNEDRGRLRHLINTIDIRQQILAVTLWALD